MKNFFKFIGTILGIAIVGVFIWAVLYFTVPKVKDWTNDNVFKHEQSKDDENTKKLEEENKSLKAQLEEITSSRNNISSELNNVKNDLDTKETALKTATEEKEQLESKVQELTYQRNEIVDKLQYSQTVNDALTLENEQLKQAKTNLELELEKKRAQLQTKESQITTLNNQIAQLKADKASLTSQLENKNQQIQQLQTQITELEQNAGSTETFAISTADVLSMGYTINQIVYTNKYVYVDILNGNGGDVDPYLGVYQISNNTLKRVGDIVRNSVYMQTENGTEVIIGQDKILMIDTEGNVSSNYVTGITFLTNDNNYLKLFVSGNKLVYLNGYDSFVYNTQDEYDPETGALLERKTTFTSENNSSHTVLKISNNCFIWFGALGGNLHKFTLDTLTETEISNYNFRVYLGNNKILAEKSGTGVVYNLETMTEEGLLIDFADCTARDFLDAKVYSVGETSDYYIVSHKGLYYYNDNDATFSQISEYKGILYEASNGDILYALLTIYEAGIYKLNGSTATKIYNSGYKYDTVTEDATGCIFSSKLNPTQASVRYDYATGTCTEVE